MRLRLRCMTESGTIEDGATLLVPKVREGASTEGVGKIHLTNGSCRMLPWLLSRMWRTAGGGATTLSMLNSMTSSSEESAGDGSGRRSRGANLDARGAGRRDARSCLDLWRLFDLLRWSLDTWGNTEIPSSGAMLAMPLARSSESISVIFSRKRFWNNCVPACDCAAFRTNAVVKDSELLIKCLKRVCGET